MTGPCGPPKNVKLPGFKAGLAGNVPAAKESRIRENNTMIEKKHLVDLLIHDLTGPLSVVSASAAKLLEKAEKVSPLTDHQRRVLERILRNAHKARTLVHEMLEISHSEEGVFRKEPFGVEKALRESFLDVLEIAAPGMVERLRHAANHKEFKTLLESHGVFIEIAGKYGHSLFSHDSMKIQQILRNLISNALKYRRERVEVLISGDADLNIQVKDDGIGIPPEDREAIFGRFVQLQKGRQPAMPGFGLGLTGVKALVEAMAGEITLTSCEGRGTCFNVRIPPLR
jgi:two-component system phosphate regulon sensor histidine kinase PhoR